MGVEGLTRLKQYIVIDDGVTTDDVRTYVQVFPGLRDLQRRACGA